MPGTTQRIFCTPSKRSYPKHEGVLALDKMSTDENDEEAVSLFGGMQVESLRIWRTLLGYGLNFRCFAYLFPVLSGFTHSCSKASSARDLALFAASEALYGLGAVHEARHYVNQRCHTSCVLVLLDLTH